MKTTKCLKEEVIENICNDIGCSIEQVRNTKDWCYFPVDPVFSRDIHYEYVNGVGVQLHIECEADSLKKAIDAIEGIEKISEKRYKLTDTPKGKLVDTFKQLKNCVQGALDEYKKTLHQKFDGKYNNYKNIKAKNVFPSYSNFFDLLPNCRNDGSDGKLSENDHTRILLAILKSGGEKFHLLRSFMEYFGIDLVVNQINRSDIVFNKRYDDDEGSSFIDGLIYRKQDFAIIVENKIEGAFDQDKQIERYIKVLNAQENVPLEKIWVIYLTKDGTLHNTGRPTKESYQDDPQQNKVYIDNRLLCINYHYDILPWLREEALPILKCTEASVGAIADCYVDYLEHMFQEDIESRKKAETMKQTIFCDLGIDNHDTIVNQYKKLHITAKELSCTPIYDDYKEALNNYMSEMVKPLYNAFEKATIDYFNKKGHEVVVRDKLYSGYIQIRGKDWNPLVHYEWYPITPYSLFFGTDPINLCVHIEGDALKERRKEFLKNKKKEEKIVCNFDNECLAQKGEMGEWLEKQYNKVIGLWDELQKIAKIAGSEKNNVPSSLSV